MCHVSYVTCKKIFFFDIFLLFFILKKLQSGGASRWRVCYQWGLPRPEMQKRTNVQTMFVKKNNLSLVKSLQNFTLCCQESE